MNSEAAVHLSGRLLSARDETVAIERSLTVADARDSDGPRNAAPEVCGSMAVANGASDEELLEQIGCRGDREALAIIFRRYATIVRAVAERILRDPAEAQDLVQEVFLFVFHKAGLFDPARGPARSWLVQVTYHRAFDRRRYLISRGFYANLGIDEAVTRAEEPRATVFSYEDTIEAAIGQDALRRIEASLSEVQRRVLHLRFFDGQSMEEIAATLGQSTGNVRNHYYRALEKMRREIFGTKLKDK